MKLLNVITKGLCISVGAALGLKKYLDWKYSHVDKGLRFQGWLQDRLVHFETVDELCALNTAGHSTTQVKLATHPLIDITESVIITEHNQALSIVVYKSKQVKPNATGLLWLHGGGYALGNPRNEVPIIQDFVLETNSIVIAPDYRLSPQAPYPAALYDAYATLLWMKQQATQLGINPNQLFVGGPSAGGGLTAATVLYARDLKEVNVAFHMPIYPMIDDGLSMASMQGNREMIWNESKNRSAWQLYLGELYGNAEVPKYAAPMREHHFEGLPPAYTFVGDLDPFYDETLYYVQRLQQANVPVTYNVYAGAYHGFDAFDCELTRQAKQQWLAAYQYAVTHYFASQVASK